ncbi:MAG: DUF4837 family protein [Candidatus Neomarinimicrobiota bacterium]|nr:MAG: DUF4837 family protein [Candidatus Neomarinimicrobiota bacterium]
MNRILIPFLLILLIAGTGCSRKREALGAENELLVLASRSDRQAIHKLLSTVFNDTLYTPQPEPEWVVKFADPDQFVELKNRTCLVIAALGDDPFNPGARLIKTLLGEDLYRKTLTTDEHVIFTADQFANDQLFLVLSALHQEELDKTLRMKRDWIRSRYDELYTRRQSKYLFRGRRLKQVERHLQEVYAWKVKIPWGWEVIHDSTKLHFVWLGREMPYQWFAVQWLDGFRIPDSNAVTALMREFPTKTFGSIRYTDFRRKTIQTDLRNWTAWKTTGVWESIEAAQGGPFFHYIFYDGVTDRTYQISAIVFDPGEEKAIRMKQLDLMAHSFEVFEGDE